MRSLKETLGEHNKTVTMSDEQIAYLQDMRKNFQLQLDRIMETEAARFLRYVAITSFDCDPLKDFQFEYHPEREIDNLIITENILR